MKRRKLYFGVGFLLACSSFLTALNFSFDGFIETKAGMYLPAIELSKNEETSSTDSLKGDISIAEISTGLEVDLWQNNSTAFLSLELSYDGVENTIPSLVLKEAWYDYNNVIGDSNTYVGFRIGKQISSWGKADAVQIADILCPQKLVDIFTADYSDGRIGIDEIRMSINTSSIAIK